jgi:hypothetical protein
MVSLADIKKDLPEWPDDVIEQWLLYFANEPDCGWPPPEPLGAHRWAGLLGGKPLSSATNSQRAPAVPIIVSDPKWTVAKRASRESGFLRGFGEPTGLRGAPSDGFKLAFWVAVIRIERTCPIRASCVGGDGLNGRTLAFSGISCRELAQPCRSPVTRQITSPTSSATRTEPSGPSVTPTGRP